MMARTHWGALLAAAFACAGCAPQPEHDHAHAEADHGPPPAPAGAPSLVPGLEPRVTVVTYHDIVEREKGVWFDTTERELLAQLDAIAASGGTFVSLQDLDDRLTEGKEVPVRSYLVTFSDGYRGVFERAWPVLREREIPFVVFMHTGHVGSELGRPKMTWGQLRELDGSGLGRVESQTVTHPEDLTRLDDVALQGEFLESKAVLEQELDRPVTALAYPNGKFDERVAAQARAAGYRLAFTEELITAESSPDLWRIGRFLHSKVPKPK